MQERLGQRSKMEAKLNVLKQQREELKRKELELKEIFEAEQSDVKKLNEVHLESLFYMVTGNKEARLNKEQSEANEAERKYDAAVAQRKRMDDSISALEVQLLSLSGIERQLKMALLEEKTYESMRAQYGFGVIAHEDQIEILKNRLKQCDEALEAGYCVQRTLVEIDKELHWASNWQKAVILDGGYVSARAKRGHLSEVQRETNLLQVQLLSFYQKMSGLPFQTEMHMSMDGGCNGEIIITNGQPLDLALLARTYNSKEKVESTRDMVGTMIVKLGNLKSEIQKQLAQLQME